MTGEIDPVTRSVVERLDRMLDNPARRREFDRAMLDLQDGECQMMEPAPAVPLKGNRAARRAARRRGA